MPVAFLADLTRLERLFHQVWDGPGTEGRPRDGSTADIRGGARLRRAPSLRLLASQFPVGSYVRAVRRGERPVIPPAAESFLAVSRQSFVVAISDLDRDRHEALDAIVGGAPVGEVVGSRAEIRGWIEAWAAAGFFS